MNRHQRRAIAAQNHPPRMECTAANINRAIAFAEQSGQPGVAELYRAVLAGDFGLVPITRRDMQIATADLAAPVPMLILIGDDDYASTGPAGWQCSSILAQWAHAAVIHASGATAETYREGVKAARICRRAVLVETSTDKASAWAELFRPKPVLLILPSDGPHPVMPSKAELQ